MKALLDMIQANKELTAVAAEAGLTIRDLMYDQARLLAQDAIKKIPPGGPDQGSAAQKKAGIEATRADISEMFWGIQDKAAMRKWHKQLIKTGGEMMIGTKQGQKMIKSNRLLYNASLADLRDKHLTWRDKKGNVRFANNADEVAGGKYIVEKRLLKKYIRSQIKKVGNLKAGFIPAGRYFEALSGKTMKGIAGWVQKQEVKSGTQVDAINKKTGVGYAELINSVSYSDIAIPMATRNALMRTRQRDIERQAKKRIKKLEKEHNDKFVKVA